MGKAHVIWLLGGSIGRPRIHHRPYSNSKLSGLEDRRLLFGGF